MKKGFTLTEVLITLSIIGVVAAMTIPTLITNNQQRSMDTAANVFNRKLGKALKVMNSQSSLAGFTTTRAFVDELSKHIKIIKTCDSNELDVCFASEFSTNEDTFKVADLKQASNLNQSGNYGTETIGVVFADGVSALIAYNPNATQDPFSNQVIGLTSTGSSKDLQVGLSTNAIAILYDTNGSATPNTYTNSKDIRGINISLSTRTCTAKLSDGTCILNLGKDYSAINCTDPNAEGYSYCTANDIKLSQNYGNNYWVGAKYACAKQNMKLPTKNELLTVYKSNWLDKPTSGQFWSASEGSAYNASYVFFNNGTSYGSNKSYYYNVLCIAN